MCFYIKPHEFTPTPIKPTDSNLSKERMTDDSCGNSVIADITTRVRGMGKETKKENEMKQMLKVKNVKVGKVWRKSYEAGKSAQRQRAK